MQSYGVDVGYGYTKVAAPDGAQVVIPSIVGSNERPSYRTNIGDRIKITPLSLDGHSYLVGEAAKRFSRHHYRLFDSSWSESPYYLLLFVFAVSQVEKGERDPIAVVTGLPVSHFSPERAKQIQKLLTRSHEVKPASGQGPLRVEKVKVIPQPFGSLFDLLLDDDGRLKDPEEVRGTAGIIDIGFQTTDLALSCPQFVEASSGSLETGVRSVTDQLARDLNRKYSITLDTAEAEEALRLKSVKIFGEKIDLTEVIKERTREVAEHILSQTHTLWGRGQKLSRLILTGGGAHLFQPYFSEYPNLYVPQQPALSNVRGYLKLAKRTKW